MVATKGWFGSQDSSRLLEFRGIVNSSSLVEFDDEIQNSKEGLNLCFSAVFFIQNRCMNVLIVYFNSFGVFFSK